MNGRIFVCTEIDIFVDEQHLLAYTFENERKSTHHSARIEVIPVAGFTGDGTQINFVKLFRVNFQVDLAFVIFFIKGK